MRHHNEKLCHMAHYPAEDINSRLIASLRDVSHTMRSLYEGKGSQRRVLMILRETGTITQRELTARLDIQSGSASEVIAKLENTGLIIRALSETDRRTADITLTEEGQRQADEALEQRRRRHEEMFSTLFPEEKTQLLSLLEKVNEDWKIRYQSGRNHHRHHHDCDHNCGACGHPCGRSRQAQGGVSNDTRNCLTDSPLP